MPGDVLSLHRRTLYPIARYPRSNVELQFNNDVHDLRGVPVPPYAEKYESLESLLNFYFSVRTLGPHRNSLFLDSVVISADW